VRRAGGGRQPPVTFRHWDDRLPRYAVALGAGFVLAAVLLKGLVSDAPA